MSREPVFTDFFKTQMLCGSWYASNGLTQKLYNKVYIYWCLWGRGKKKQQTEEPSWVSVCFFASQEVIWKSSIYSPTTFSLAAGRSKSFFCSSGLSGDSAQRQRTGTLQLQAQIKAVLVTRVNNKKLIKSVLQILCSTPISSSRLYLKLY